MPKILVTNDDGIDSDGIKALADSLSTLGDVIVVAPSTDMTAVSHSLTLHSPLRIEKRDEACYAVTGTPTDCVVLAINILLNNALPDLVVSGINRGANLGDDIHYSGTVAGAMEGTFYGIASIAVSLAGRERYDFQYAAQVAKEISSNVLKSGLPKGTLLNVNVPRGPIKGIALTRQASRSAGTEILINHDPRNRPYYWVGYGKISWEQNAGTDFAAIKQGLVSITPIKNDMTNYAHLSELEKWDGHWLSVYKQDSPNKINELDNKDNQDHLY
ncbi:MAG: 5'/3'-nucleotidase SurE [Acidobacteria bacterium]|nr:5'/3'-nucleotidase SurE [Acidobacteriota bacterium]